MPYQIFHFTQASDPYDHEDLRWTFKCTTPEGDQLVHTGIHAEDVLWEVVDTQPVHGGVIIDVPEGCTLKARTYMAGRPELNSGWSNEIVVPDVDLLPAILVGTLLLGALFNERARQRHRQRALQPVWQRGQRRPLFRRVRQVLRRRLRLVGRWFRWRRS